ncbi:MAG: rod shape-determining protein RodA [Phycisphaerales bacterium]|nr:rod shape-determining protein RodA [Phycisphaerales bacterium]
MTETRILHFTRVGWGVVLPVAFLLAAGVACIHSTDRQSARSADREPTYTLGERPWAVAVVETLGPTTLRQIAFAVTGVILMLLTLRVSYQKIGWYAYPAYAVLLVLLLLLFLDRYIDLPLITERKGSRRWIDLGILSLQPSEFMKPALILVLARYLRFRSSHRRWWGLLPPFMLTVIPMILIVRQPDLGTTLMLLPVLAVMLFVSGARIRHLLIVATLVTATLPAFYFYGMREYQRVRVQVLFRQGVADESWQMNEGYQLRQAKTALGTGGIWGTGYREGIFVQHYLLPEEDNDFIFAIYGHQWGLVGALLLLLAYSLIVLFGLEVATITNDPFGRLLAVGVVAMIVTQALLNICMNIGLAPITGMTLPFVSAGGSSLWANFIALGLLVNVAQRRPLLIARPPFEHKDAT